MSDTHAFWPFVSLGLDLFTISHGRKMEIVLTNKNQGCKQFSSIGGKEALRGVIHNIYKEKAGEVGSSNFYTVNRTTHLMNKCCSHVISQNP